MFNIKIRHCPVCKTSVHWGKKVGRCKCPGKFWRPIFDTTRAPKGKLTPAK